MNMTGPLALDFDQVRDRTWVEKIHSLEETPSTNTLALERARQHPDAHSELFIARRQTAGRGRGRNRWWSADGALTFSVLTPPLPIPTAHIPRASLAVGVALCQGVEGFLPEHQVQMKWPNDVYVDGRKLAGVLIERPASATRSMVVGVGMNVLNSLAEAPVEIRLTATSLVDLRGVDSPPALDPTELLIRCLSHLGDRLGELAAEDHHLPDLWRRYSLLTNADVEITLPRGSLRGRCISIADDGALLVETPAGIEACHGGVVSRWGPVGGVPSTPPAPRTL